MKFTLEIYRPSAHGGGRMVSHLTQVHELASERDAAMVLVAAREAVPQNAGWMVGMMFTDPKTKVRTNVRVQVAALA